MTFRLDFLFRIGGWSGGLSDGTARHGIDGGVDVHGKARDVNDV